MIMSPLVVVVILVLTDIKNSATKLACNLDSLAVKMGERSKIDTLESTLHNNMEQKDVGNY